MLYRLPPAGDAVAIDGNAPLDLDSFTAPYQWRLYASGTAALAAALVAAVRYGDVRQPQVLLPGYACPDLVAAAVCAGVEPVLVDLMADRPWMDLDKAGTLVTDRCVAIVGVDLFGIPERLEELAAFAREHGLVFIEDSAQLFPGREQEPIWKGDMVVLSFGRGKPVSLLGGGAVLTAAETLHRQLPRPGPRGHSAAQRRRFRLYARLYNLLRKPRLFWLPSALPWLGLGATQYQPLDEITAMDPERERLLPGSVAAYRRRCDAAQEQLAAGLARLPRGSGILDLAQACGGEHVPRLLRYPLLCRGRGQRDTLLGRLDAEGLGASAMYPAALPDIPGVDTAWLSGDAALPQARAFASRVLTLPVHGDVPPRRVDRMLELIVRDSG